MKKRMACMLLALALGVLAAGCAGKARSGMVGQSQNGWFVLVDEDENRFGFVVTEETEIIIEDAALREMGVDKIVAGLHVDAVAGDAAEQPPGFIGLSPDEELPWHAAERVAATGAEDAFFMVLGGQ